MINEITKYRTNDGKEFLTEDVAKEHILDNLKNAFGNHFKSYVDSGDIKFKVYTEMIDTLFSDIEKAEEWCSILVKNLKEDY